MPGSRKDVLFLGPVVLKKAHFNQEELDFLRVETPGIHRSTWSLMPRGRPVREPSELRVGFEHLIERHWSRAPASPRPDWRARLRAHLLDIYPSRELLDRVDLLPEPTTPATIHGDATLANLVDFGPRRGLRWIDPLARAYVPHDFHVDIGKGLQSAWNYEGVLRGESAGVFFSLYRDLIQLADDRVAAVTWMLVHLARLLRYHPGHVAREFTRVLNRYGCNIA